MIALTTFFVDYLCLVRVILDIIVQSQKKRTPQKADIIVGYGSDANETKLCLTLNKKKIIKTKFSVPPIVVSSDFFRKTLGR